MSFKKIISLVSQKVSRKSKPKVLKLPFYVKPEDYQVAPERTVNFNINKLLIVGLCRDNAIQLKNYILANIESVEYDFAETFVCLVENDSTDDTKQVLKDWSEKQSEVHQRFILNLPSMGDAPRTDRIAKARNAYLHYCEDVGLYNDYDYLLMLDCDEVNEFMPNGERIKKAINGASKDHWFSLTANSNPAYYDVWALRSFWSPNDCWRECKITKDPAFSVFQRQVTIRDTLPNIPCQSAFNGLAIYKTKYLSKLRYSGSDLFGEVCEHPGLHQLLRERSHLLTYICPELCNGVVSSKCEHIQGNEHQVLCKNQVNYVRSLVQPLPGN